ncbi:MAG: hypothetical protein KC470_03030 [Dehalococcoidia bacterium]|nr:hypothetical protein [Dehalococcoidia bacterium]
MPTGYRLPLALAAGAALVAGDAWATTVLPQFDARAFEPGAPVDNAYFPLRPGQRTVLSAKGEEDGEPFTERSELSVLKRGGPTILGVRATVQRDRAFEDGLLVEDTFDYYAQDRAGNVWYLGEDSTEYADGKAVSKHGSWEAGVDGALAGIIMQANPAVGQAYRQEYYKDEAEDLAKVIAVGGSQSITFGDFDEVVTIQEWTPLEPAVVENKFFAPGVGAILEEKVLGEEGRVELVSYNPAR